MIDYKNKDLHVKTNKEKTTKLMIQANKRNNNIKQRKVSTQDIQPMERKENYKTEPNVPSNQKISAPDGNAFIDNIEFLNEKELAMLEELNTLEKILNLMKGSNDIIKEKIKFVPIIENYPEEKYDWSFYTNDRIPRSSGAYDGQSKAICGAHVTKEVAEKILDYKIIKTVGRNTITGKFMENIIHTVKGPVITKIYTDTENFDNGTVISSIQDTPLNFVNKNPKNGDKYGFNSWLGSAGMSESSGNIRFSNLGIPVMTNGKIGPIYVDIPENDAYLLFPQTNDTDYIRRSSGGATLTKPDHFKGGKLRSVYGAMEIAQDFEGLTNYFKFITLQLKYNSKYSKDGNNSPVNPEILKFLNDPEGREYALELCSQNSEKFNPVSIYILKQLFLDQPTGKRFFRYEYGIDYNGKGPIKVSGRTIFKRRMVINGEVGLSPTAQTNLFFEALNPVDFKTIGDGEQDIPGNIREDRYKVYLYCYYSLFTNYYRSILDGDGDIKAVKVADIKEN